ncbi:MAG: 3-hydroxyacyl-CoA dehydrogenase NAD-binding domain-containing protein, partial [Ignisphaera sp.]
MPYEGLMLNDEVLGSYERRREHVITVVGCGRIGLPTACLFADAGFRVVCFDINSNVITQISAGKSPFLEPGLED